MARSGHGWRKGRLVLPNTVMYAPMKARGTIRQGMGQEFSQTEMIPLASWPSVWEGFTGPTNIFSVGYSIPAPSASVIAPGLTSGTVAGSPIPSVAAPTGNVAGLLAAAALGILVLLVGF